MNYDRFQFKHKTNFLQKLLMHIITCKMLSCINSICRSPIYLIFVVFLNMKYRKKNVKTFYIIAEPLIS